MASVQFARARGTVNDICGDRVGRWSILRFAGRRAMSNNRTRPYWLCRCDCGTEREVSEDLLRRAASTSCGCKQVEAAVEAGRATKTHGMKRRTEYFIWSTMKQRCLNPKSNGYARYGGRGINICDRWRDSFEAFYEDMGPRPSNRHSIDRIDNDGGYEPSNCRWSEIEQQVRNRRSTRWVQFRGATMCLADVAELVGMNAGTLRARLQRGWSLERAAVPF